MGIKRLAYFLVSYCTCFSVINWKDFFFFWYSVYLYIYTFTESPLLIADPPMFFNRGKMNQNGQEAVKQSGVGLTEIEGKVSYLNSTWFISESVENICCYSINLNAIFIRNSLLYCNQKCYDGSNDRPFSVNNLLSVRKHYSMPNAKLHASPIRLWKRGQWCARIIKASVGN